MPYPRRIGRLGVLALAATWGLGGCSVDGEDLFGEASSGGTESTTGSLGNGGGAGTGGGGSGGATATGATTGATTTGATTGAATTGATTGATTVTSTAAGAMCGDGTKNGMEQCDGADLDGATCQDVGYSEPGVVTCAQGCTLDYAACKPSCGDGNLEPTEECDDGNTADAFDGCSPDCHLLGVSCSTAIDVMLALGARTANGSTDQVASAFQPQATAFCPDGTGPDLVFAITATQPGFVTAWLPKAETNFDSVLYFRNECANSATELLCNDNAGMGDNGGEVVSTRLIQGQTIFLFVDGYQGDMGDFQLRLDLSKGDTCADPVPITVEGTGDLRLLGSTAGYVSDAASSLSCTSAGAGPDAVYAVTVSQMDTYFLDLTASFNSVLHARTACSDVLTEIACQSPAGNDSSINFTTGNAGTFFTWVDGTSNQSGVYALDLSH